MLDNPSTRWIVRTVFFVAFGGASVAAQTGLDPKIVPVRSGSVAGFVPAGWEIEQQLEGTLISTTQPDVVVQLVQRETSRRADDARALVILIRNAGGELERAAVGAKLLEPRHRFGKTPPKLTIARNVLTVSGEGGLQRFRYDSQSKQFELIGEDVSASTAGTVSTNYVTGGQVVQQREYDPATKKTVTSTHAATAGKIHRTIEDTSWTDDIRERRIQAMSTLAALPAHPDDRIPAPGEDENGEPTTSIRIPRMLFVQLRSHLEGDYLTQSIQDLAGDMRVTKQSLIDSKATPADRRFPADTEFYWLGGPEHEFCAHAGCEHWLCWISPATGQGGILLQPGGTDGTMGHLVPLASSSHGLRDFTLRNMRTRVFTFDGTRYVESKP